MFHQRLLPFEAVGLRGAVSPPAGPGQPLWGVQGEKPTEDLEILHFTVPRGGQKTTPFTCEMNTRSEEKLIKFRNL